MSAFSSDDPRIETILACLAAHARVDRSRLRPELRASELGLSPLDVALALFEIENRLDIDLPAARADPATTIAEIVAQALAVADGTTPV